MATGRSNQLVKQVGEYLVACELARQELLVATFSGDVPDFDGWIKGAIGAEGQLRDGRWSESIAVGSESFVTMTKEKLGFKAKAREVVGEEGSYVFRESPAPYKSILGHENDALRPENAYFWDHNL
jgi:hypothetical protein